MILIKRPGDLIEGTRRCGKVVIVSGTLVAVHGGEGVAGRLEGVQLLVLQFQLTLTAMSLRAITPRKNITSLLGRVVMRR